MDKPKKLHCPNCGAEVESGDLYCMECGSHIKYVQTGNDVPPEKAADVSVPEVHSETGKEIPVQKDSVRKSGGAVILIAVLVLVVIVMSVLLFQAYDEIDYLEDRVDDLIWDRIEALHKLDFYDTYIVIVPDDGSGLYHKYDCAYLDRSCDFWAFNIEAAKNQYKPCSHCIG